MARFFIVLGLLGGAHHLAGCPMVRVFHVSDSIPGPV